MSRTPSKLTFGKLHLKVCLGILGSSTSSMDAHTSTVMDIYALLYRPKKIFVRGVVRGMFFEYFFTKTMSRRGSKLALITLTRVLQHV